MGVVTMIKKGPGGLKKVTFSGKIGWHRIGWHQP